MIPEPTTSMWPELRRMIDNLFPIWVDENAAFRIAQQWRHGADTFEAAAARATAMNNQVPDFWRDTTGTLFQQKVNRMLNSKVNGAPEIIDGMRQLSALADEYGRSIVWIKDQIYAELLANGAAFLASFALPPGLGDWARRYILEGAAGRIAAIVAAAVARVAAAAPKLTKLVAGIAGEMLEEPAIQLTGNVLDMMRGQRDAIDWNQVWQASLAGGAGALLNIPVNPIARVIGSPARVVTLGTPPKFRKSIIGATETFISNGITSPVSGTFVNAVAAGEDPWQQNYFKAIYDQGLGAGVLAVSRIGAHGLGHTSGDYVFGRTHDGAATTTNPQPVDPATGLRPGQAGTAPTGAEAQTPATQPVGAPATAPHGAQQPGSIQQTAVVPHTATHPGSVQNAMEHGSHAVQDAGAPTGRGNAQQVQEGGQQSGRNNAQQSQDDVRHPAVENHEPGTQEDQAPNAPADTSTTDVVDQVLAPDAPQAGPVQQDAATVNPIAQPGGGPTNAPAPAAPHSAQNVAQGPVTTNVQAGPTSLGTGQQSAGVAVQPHTAPADVRGVRESTKETKAEAEPVTVEHEPAGPPDGPPPHTAETDEAAPVDDPNPPGEASEQVVHAPEGPGFVRGTVEVAPVHAEVLAAGARARKEHFGGLLTADPVVVGDRLVVQANDGNTYEFALEVEAVAGKHAAQTRVGEDGGPYTTRIDPGVKREQWTRAWVHEIGHAVREAMRARAGEHEHTEDLCIEAEQDVRRLVADQAAEALEAAERSGLPEDRAVAKARQQELVLLDSWLQARIDARTNPWFESSEPFPSADVDAPGRWDRPRILRLGRNVGRIVFGEDGRVREARARIREDHGDGDRGGRGSHNRKAVTRESGIAGDSGGHFLARRFFHNDEFWNLFAQNLISNKLMFGRMEEEWAALTKLGYEVEVVITPSPGWARPGEVIVTYTVLDPARVDPRTGQEHVVWASGRSVVNAAGETYFGFFEAQLLRELETAGTTSFGANTVTRTAGSDGVVNQVEAVLRQVDAPRIPLSKQAVGRVLVAREGVPLDAEGKVLGFRLFGPAGIAALLPAGTTIDPVEYARLEQEWIGHIEAGRGVTVEVSRPGTPGQHVELTFTVTASPAPYNSRPSPRSPRSQGPPNSVHAPNQPGFDGSSREAGRAPADQQEVLDAARQARPSDFGGLIDGPVLVSGDLVVVNTPNLGQVRFRAHLGPVQGDRVARTDLSTTGGPHETTIEPGLRTDQFTRAWVHEISHTLKELAKQKLIQEGYSGPFEDACLASQVNEHTTVQRQLNEARVKAARTGRAADQHLVQKLEAELEGLRQSLERQGIHGASLETTDATAWQEIDGGSVGPRQVRSYGGNVVARPTGPMTTGESVIAEVRKLIPDAVPAMMRAIAAAARLNGVPLLDDRPVGWSFFGTSGLAALGVSLDVDAFHRFEIRLGALIAKGYTATLALTKLPSPTSTTSDRFRYTVALTAADGSVTMHSAVDLNTLTASLPFEIAAPATLPEAPAALPANRPGIVGRMVQRLTGPAAFDPGWFVVIDEAQRALLRTDVWAAAGIAGVTRMINVLDGRGGIYQVQLAGAEEFRLTLSVGRTATELWAESSLVFGSRGPVLALVLSDRMAVRDVAPVLARVIAETVAVLARGAATAEGAKVFGPATQPRTSAVQTVEDIGDRAELRHRAEVMKAYRRRDFLQAALQRIDGTKLLTQMGLRDHQRSAELLRTLLAKSERDLAALLDTGKSLKDERAGLSAYEAKALRGSGLTNTVIAVTTAIVTGNPLLGIGIFVPALTNALVGGVMERWLDARKEVGRQPAYDADRAARDERNPGLRGLLDDVVNGARRQAGKLPRATSLWNYTIRYGVSSLSTAAVVGVLEWNGVPAVSSLLVIAGSSLAKWLTEKLVDAKKLDYRLSRVDRSIEARMTDPGSLDNLIVNSFTDLHDRLDRALSLLTGQPRSGPLVPAGSVNSPPGKAKREMPPFWLHAVVQAVDGLSSAGRRYFLNKVEDVSDPTELSRALSAQIEHLIGALGPVLPTGVLGAFGEMRFLNLEEAAGDAQKNYDAVEREAAQGARTVADLRPWFEILDQRVRLLEAMAGLAPELGVRAGERAGFPQAPPGPDGGRPYGQRSPLIYSIPVLLASIGGVGGTLLLNWQLGLAWNSVVVTIAGAAGAIAGTPFARYGFRRAELNRKDEVAAARAKQEADPRKLLEQRAMVRYLVTQLTLRAEVFLARTQDAPAVLLPAITTRSDQIRYAINQAVRELAGLPGNKPKLFERLVAMEQVLDTLEALEHHTQHGTPDSIALLEEELAKRLGLLDELWQEQGQQSGFPLPPLVPARSAIQQALNPAPKPPSGPHYGREVRGTRFVRDGRPASEGVLDGSVALDAVSGTNKEDFGGLLEAAPERLGDLVVARPGGATPQHFRVEVGRVRRGRMARTYLHSGTAADPHVVRIAPGVANDQLARVWVHEISHALHALHGHGVGGRVRQVLSRITGAVVDACIEAQINEHRFLARRWGEAKTTADRAAEELLRNDLEGLAKAIERLGHTPPPAPWAGPVELAGIDLQQESHRLAHQVADLQAHRTDKMSSAKKAEKAAHKADRQARVAARNRDQGRFARVREKLAESVKQRDLAQWHQQRADAYQNAETQAARLQAMYERLLAATPDQRSQQMAELTTLRIEYDQAIAALAPPQIALPNMMPTGALPQISRLAERVNAELARLGVEHRFTAESLQNRLSAEFGRLVTPEGAVLRFGTAELRITLSVSELQEVLRPSATSSEMMVGVMPQRGRRVGTAATSRIGLGVDQSLRDLTRLLIDQIPTIAGVGEYVTARFGTSFNRSLAVSGTAAEFAQDGAVEDNRGESLLYKGEGGWRIDVRTPETVRWSTVPADDLAGEIRGWVSHVYTVPAAKDTATSGQQPHGRLPDALVSSITGLHDLSDTVTSVFRGRLQRLGTAAENVRRQIREAITHDLAGRLAESTERVILQPLQADGVPIGHLEITTTVRYEQTEPVGAQSATHWQERLRVGFTTVSGQAGYGTGLDGKTTFEVGPADLTAVDGSGNLFNAEASIGMSASRGEAQSVGGTAIQVGVHRFTGPTQGYRMVLEHKVVLVLDGHRAGAVSGNSEALVRLRTNDAFHHGLPVDEAALVRDDQGQLVVDSNGRRVVRGDVRPDSRTPEQIAKLIPGRKLELPVWSRPGAGVGPALVQDVTGGNEALAQIIGGLTERGYLPPLRSDGTIDLERLTKDPVERHGQILNLEELVAQLSPQRLEAGYDAAVQTGLLLTLTRPRTLQPTESVTLRIDLVQEVDGVRPVGVTSDQDMGTLNIGSDGAGRFGSPSKAAPFSVKPLGIKDPTADDGSGGKVGFSRSGSMFGRMVGFLSGGTINQVTLVESTSPLAVFEIAHRLIVTEVGRGTETVLHEGPGTARVLLDSDLLPYSKDVFEASTTPGRVRQAVLDRATVLAFQTPDLLAAVPAQVTRDPVARQLAGAFLNPRNLVAHPEWTATSYRTAVIVNGRGPIWERYTLGVTGIVRDATLIGVTDGVSGDINFAMGNHGAVTGWSSSRSAALSESAAVDDNPNDEAAPEGAGLSASIGRTTSASAVDQAIWGVERLAIEVGRHYVFAARADLSLTLANEDRQFAEHSDTGELVFQIAERDALAFYAKGELALPLQQVADAVERYLNGSLTLDTQTATAVIIAYRSALTDGPKPARDSGLPRLWDRHGPARLLAKLGAAKADSLFPARARLYDLLAKFDVDGKDLPVVPVPPQYRHSLGSSLVESAELDGTVLAAVLGVLRSKLGVQFTNDPAIAEAFFGELAGKRWWGRLDDMLAPNGFTRSFPVRRPGTLVPERGTVRIRAELDDSGVQLGDSKTTVSIVQRYLYGDRSATRGRGQSLGGGLDGSLDSHADPAAQTGRSESVSHSFGEQQTRLERMATFGGVTRLRRGLILHIEVVHNPTAAPASGRVRQAFQPTDARPGTSRTRTAVLTGRLIQLVPTGYLTPRATPDAPTGDTTPVELPETYFVEAVGRDDGARLLAAIKAELANRSLLAPDGARLRTGELESQLSPSALHAAFSQMASADGYRIARLRVPGQASRAVDVVIRVVPSNPEVLTDAVPKSELGVVNRTQSTTSTTVTRGRLLPASGSTTLPLPGIETKPVVSVGEQLFDQTTDVRGIRWERSRFEGESMVTVRHDVRYEVTLIPVQVLGLNPERPDRPLPARRLPWIPGEVYVSGHDHEIGVKP
ncbi:hypothetical protein ACI2LF_08360 [Kribbella sp. NPDC020789]